MSNKNMAIACPDPSLHRDTKLQEQASTAALYVTSPARQKQSTSDILDGDNKLSSRSAAMSLKHARPEDLPSYPSSGGMTSSNSNSAALLAHGNQKSFEHWKPDPSSAAGKAALIAKDYKMAPLWQPGMSEAGSKAALLAHRDGGKVDLWTPQPSANGSSAATLAFKKTTLSPTIDYGSTPDGRSKALLAATKSVSRARSGSVPTPSPAKYPDSANSASNALNAATIANRKPSAKSRTGDEMASPALEESRIRHLSDKISKQMWTEHPPVDIEVEEKRHQDALRASAVSMAKGMYDLAERRSKDNASSQGATAATAVAKRNSTGTQPDIRQQAMQYIHLQEAAHKLAEERLAKLDPDGAARFREHYGYPLRSPRRRLSVKDRYRRRANSDSHLSDSDDEMTSRRIRNQMSQFNKELETVDQKKRQTDRAALLAAAEKKVQAQMHTMDEKVYAETGKVSQSMMEQWEAKAREKAARDSAKRTENFGKADIGGGKFMEQSEIEAIAAARLKPTLDEINENAEKRRARDEEIRLDQEQRRRQEMSEKQKEKELKNLQKQSKQEEKAAHKQEREQQKAAAKIEKDAEKARKAEEKKAAKEEKRRSKDVKKEAAAAAGTSAVAHEASKDPQSNESIPLSSAKTSEEVPAATGPPAEAEAESISPVISRSATGEPVLHDSVERHVSQIDTSDSEDESTPAVVPATTATAKGEKRIGTDGEIGKTTPKPIDTTKAKEDNTANSPTQSPKSPHRFGRFMDKFKRRSKHASDVEPGTLTKLRPRSSGKAAAAAEKEERSGPSKGAQEKTETEADKDEGTAATKATVDPTEPALAPLSAVEAQAISNKHANAAISSPSSFVRGEGARTDDVSSLSSLTSDEEELVPSAPAADSGEKKDAAKEGETGTTKGKGKGLLGGLGTGIGKTTKEEEGRGGSLEMSRSPVRETRFQEQL